MAHGEVSLSPQTPRGGSMPVVGLGGHTSPEGEAGREAVGHRETEKVSGKHQGKRKGASALHCKEPVPSPGRNKGLLPTQSEEGWFFSAR